MPLPQVGQQLVAGALVSASMRTRWMPSGRTTSVAPRTMLAKNGSENIRACGSETTSPMEPVARVTRLRAARFGW